MTGKREDYNVHVIGLNALDLNQAYSVLNSIFNSVKVTVWLWASFPTSLSLCSNFKTKITFTDMAIYDLRTQKVWLFYIPTLQFWGDSSNHSGFIILIFKMGLLIVPNMAGRHLWIQRTNSLNHAWYIKIAQWVLGLITTYLTVCYGH